jgi:hypothetical protein
MDHKQHNIACLTCPSGFLKRVNQEGTCMATPQLYRRAWVGLFLLAVLIVLCPGCCKDKATPSQHALEPDNQTPCLMDAPETAATVPVGAWTMPDEWNAEAGEGGTPLGYREPTDSGATPTETAIEQPWTPESMGNGEDNSCYTVTYPSPDEQQCTPEPMGDGDDSGCNVTTGATTDENQYMRTISDTLNTELDEQMQAVPETPNTETDEASGLVGEEGPNYHDEMGSPSMMEGQDTTSPTGPTNDGNSDLAGEPSP